MTLSELRRTVGGTRLGQVTGIDSFYSYEEMSIVMSSFLNVLIEEHEMSLGEY